MLHSGLWLRKILAVCHSIPFLGSSPVFVSQVYSHKNTFNVHHIKPFASFTWSDTVLEHPRVPCAFFWHAHIFVQLKSHNNMQPNAHISVLYMQQQFAWLKIAYMDKSHAKSKNHTLKKHILISMYLYFSIVNIIAYFINKKNQMVN